MAASAGPTASSPPMAVMLTVGTGLPVSTVKLKTVGVLVLLALSVWRTCTVLAPSCAVKVLLQVLPSVLYSTKASVSMSPMFRLPTVLILSLWLRPVSHSKLTAGEATVLSMTTARLMVASTALPACKVRSICTLPEAMASVGVTDHRPLLSTTVVSTSPVPGMVTLMRSPSEPLPVMVGVS